MRYSIVDNSTLTAIERLLGHIPVSNKYALDGDITALESLVQGILFFDKLFVVDDYKPEHREDRLSQFSFLNPLAQGAFNYDGIMRHAHEMTASMAPQVQKSMVQDDDFAPFLELLRMNIAFTWRMASSVFWLTVNLLREDPSGEEIHRYSKLWASIVTQLETRSRSTASDAATDRISILNQDGDELDLANLGKDEGARNEVAQLASSLSWLALRTCFYSLLAQASGADLILHPVRHAFRLNMLKRRMGMSEDVFRPIIERLDGRIAETITEVLAATDPLIGTMQLPIFSAWIVSRTKDPRHVLEAAHDVARTEPLIRARAALADLDALDPSSKQFVREANQLFRDLDSTVSRIRSDFGVSTPQGIPLSPVVKIANVGLQNTLGASIPDLGLKLPMPNWFARWRDGRGLRSVFRSVVEDLAAVGRLGRIRTQLSSAADIQPDASFPRPAIEDAKWFGRDSPVRRW